MPSDDAERVVNAFSSSLQTNSSLCHLDLPITSKAQPKIEAKLIENRKHSDKLTAGTGAISLCKHPVRRESQEYQRRPPRLAPILEYYHPLGSQRIKALGQNAPPHQLHQRTNSALPADSFTSGQHSMLESNWVQARTGRCPSSSTETLALSLLPRLLFHPGC